MSKPPKLLCPQSGNILEFYDGRFESVYVILHPFLRVRAEDLNKFGIEIAQLQRKHGPVDVVTHDDGLEKFELLERCEPVTWKTVLELTSLSDISEINIGLQTAIRALRKEFCKPDIEAKLVSLKSHNIVMPEEGSLPPILENRILAALKSLGHDWVWVSDEFDTKRNLHLIDDLIQTDILPYRVNIFPKNHDFLLTTHWDSHFSFLCSSKEKIEAVLAQDAFEGFYCTSKTEIGWSIFGI
ncbi:DUF2711 domain-containing protein [Aestuariispira ectoiniformans]|uniref:DUF2711 domain-containing protein n=1 Tax=Aestuariispira ectoiniformans TaxID=2775080 RepID=UPI00223A752C|nr:DUF2711 domain-containing protein [Aestuariispira ectoiniformans]